ncbi:MAG: flavodoxin family protein [Thermoprotei archaeon]|nr:MAG: flavodoxin family protein [Thermoprotei archaeon]
MTVCLPREVVRVSILVLGVNGSPREYGNTYRLLRVALEGARSEGARVEIRHLHRMRIEPCKGCVSDDERSCRYPCIIDDDMKRLYDELLEADGLIIATPVYWYNVSGHVKNFIDRLTALENMIHFEGRSWLEGKVAGFIAVGNDVGALAVIQGLMAVMNSMGMLVPPWALAYYERRGDVLEDEQAILDAWNVGRAVAIAAKLLKEADVRWYVVAGAPLQRAVRRARREARELELRQRATRLKLFKALAKAGLKQTGLGD